MWERFSFYGLRAILILFMTAPAAIGGLASAIAQGEGFKLLVQGWGIDPAASWLWGFGFGATGMALGLLQYVLTGKRLGDAGLTVLGSTTPQALAAGRRKLLLGVGAVVVLIAIL